MCLVAVSFPTLPRLLVDPLFGLSFGKKARVAVQISHLRDRSPPLMKLVFNVQVAEDEEMMM